jgi:SAM-dependent methyltransferase
VASEIFFVPGTFKHGQHVGNLGMEMKADDGKDQRSRWDSTYSANRDFFGKGASQLGRSALPVLLSHRIKRVLELGCGQGRDTLFLAENGMEVTALDYSEAGLCQIRSRAESVGVQGSLVLKIGDARDGLPFDDGTFDACFSHMFFTMQLTEKELAFIFAEVLRVLRPGGLNIFSVRNVHDPHFRKGEHFGEGMWQNPLGFVVHFFDEDKVRRLASGYQVLWIREFDDPTPPFTKKLYEVALRKPDK